MPHVAEKSFGEISDSAIVMRDKFLTLVLSVFKSHRNPLASHIAIFSPVFSDFENRFYFVC